MNLGKTSHFTAKKTHPLRSFAAGLVFFLICSGPLFGETATIDFPLISGTPQEAIFFDSPKESIETNLDRVELPLSPVGDTESVFLTVVFFEREGGILSVTWSDAQTQATTSLAENLNEGIAGWNQRTIRVPDDLSHVGGTLVLEANSPTRIISRVVVSRVQAAAVYDSSDPGTSFVSADGRVFTRESLESKPPLVPPDAWLDGIQEAYLQENIEKADGNIQFVAPLEQVPEIAIFRVEAAGLSGGAAPTLWVNGVNVGKLAVEVPDLRNPGYLRAPYGGLEYAGWRKGSVEINAKLLRPGDNDILIETPHSGVFLKNALLQMQYSKKSTATSPTVENSDVIPDYSPEPIPVTVVSPDPVSVESPEIANPEISSSEPPVDESPAPLVPSVVTTY